MTDTIEPALTSEQWRHRDLRGLSCYAAITQDQNDNVGLEIGDKPEHTTYWFTDHPHGSPFVGLHQIIALANAALPDEHPGKITWAGIESATRLVNLLDDPSRYWGGMGDDERNELHASFDRLIAALRSLLPEPSAQPRGGA